MIIKPFIKNRMLGEGTISRCCFSPWDPKSCGEVVLGRTTLLIEGIRQKSSGQSRPLELPETAPLHSWPLGVLHSLVPWKISVTTCKPAIYHFAELVALLLLGSVRGQS